VAAAEARRKPGTVMGFRRAATVSDVDLGGRAVTTWAYDGRIPGSLIRVSAGQQVKLVLANQLSTDTSVHWHGIALRNNADGVPMVTQQPVVAGAEYAYQFTATTAGTYWFHPHSGTQLDRGLYAPLIVDDPAEPLHYDHEWIVVLDDWLDGTGRSPDQVLADLRKGMGHMTGRQSTAASSLLGGAAGDVSYPLFLLNGRIPSDPDTLRAKPGDRVRIRFINAAADTAFRVALSGHAMTITHTDGFPVVPTESDGLLIGMGERYDVLATLGDGVFALTALAEGKNGSAIGLIRTGAGQVPPPSSRPAELDRRILTYSQLKPTAPVMLPARPVDRSIRLSLTGGMMSYDWGINGRTYDHRKIDSAVRQGERVRLDFVNTTMMFHPVHLHGHTFAIVGTGLRKDTAIVLPGQTLSTIFDADNPGLWMIHCHNAYHAEAGMMTLLGYLRDNR
jgi:FtsP/CotA-like multicopper oxidase with cupredoxin domain